jgi:hypothetical protein
MPSPVRRDRHQESGDYILRKAAQGAPLRKGGLTLFSTYPERIGVLGLLHTAINHRKLNLQNASSEG